MLNNSEIIFVIGKAIKRRQSRSSGEALQRSILQKEARINDNLSVDRVLGTNYKSKMKIVWDAFS
jgi:hypothetical protein